MKKPKVCFDAGNMSHLKIYVMIQRTNIFYIKSFCKAQIFRKIIFIYEEIYTFLILVIMNITYFSKLISKCFDSFAFNVC